MFAAVDPFEGPRLKIERAKKHFTDFRAAADALAKSNIVETRPETDPETGWLRTPVWLNEPLPPELRLIAADALYNLRSALDQAVCRCAVFAGETADNTYFPHGKDRAGFERALHAKCKKVPELVRRAIAALEPYHGGNGYLLRILHDLNLVDKHSDLIAIGIAVSDASFSPGKGILPAGEIWQRTENKFERLSPTAVQEVHHHVKITLTVSFADIEAIQNQSAIKVLAQFCDLVVQAVDVIEEALRHAVDNSGTPPIAL